MAGQTKGDIVTQNLFGERANTSNVNIGNTLYVKYIESTNKNKDNITGNAEFHIKSYTQADTTGRVRLDKQGSTNNLMLDGDTVLSVGPTGNIEGDLLNGIDLSVGTIAVNNIDTNTIDTKNLDIGDSDTNEDVGYINFRTSDYGQGYNNSTRDQGIGFRIGPTGVIEMKNATGDILDWTELTGVETTLMTKLKDVTINPNTLQDNDILRYDGVFDDWVNSANLTIREYLNLDTANLSVDTANINLSNGYIKITDNYGIVDSIGSNILVFKGETTSLGDGNYFKMTNAVSGADITFEADGVDNNISMDIKSKGTGDVTLNSDSGNVVVSSINIDILGYVKNSIYRITSNSSYAAETNWNIPLGYDTLLYNFNGTHASGTYFSNITAGVDGQKLNLIYNNSGSNNIDLIVDFDSNLITGSGNSGRLKFISTGQTANLVYLGDDIDKWQIINTGCIVLE
jgi:hypothetical protein